MEINKKRIMKIISLLIFITLITSTFKVFIKSVSAETFKIQGTLIPMSGEGTLITEFWIEEAYSGKQIDLSKELIIGRKNDYVFNVSLSSIYMNGLATWVWDGRGCDFDTGANIEYLPELKLNEIVLTPVSVGLDSDSVNYILKYKLDSTKNNNIGQQYVKTISFDTERTSNGYSCYMAFYDLETKEVSENYNLIYRCGWDVLEHDDCDITIDFKSPIMRIRALGKNDEGEGTEGTFRYYKKNDVLEIYLYSTEYLYSENLQDETAPDVLIKFGNGEFITPTYKRVEECDRIENEEERLIRRYIYEYEIQEQDDGQLALFFGTSERYDCYGNTATYNSAYGVTGEGFKGNYIYADSKVPTGTLTYVPNADGSVTAKVSFDEENVTITSKGGDTHTFKENGDFTFTFIDQAGNEGSAIATVNYIKEPKVEFNTLKTKVVDGKLYVKVLPDITVDAIKGDIKQEGLAGKSIDIDDLDGGRVVTGSTITIDGQEKCIIVVMGDLNGDGEINFEEDIIRANNYRLGLINLEVEQKLASDIDDDGKIDFTKDLIKINNYRLGLINSL